KGVAGDALGIPAGARTERRQLVLVVRIGGCRRLYPPPSCGSGRAPACEGAQPEGMDGWVCSLQAGYRPPAGSPGARPDLPCPPSRSDSTCPAAETVNPEGA